MSDFSLIYQVPSHIVSWAPSIYVGDETAASGDRPPGVKGVLNVAYDMDDDTSAPRVQYAKVGLYDGPGNLLMTLAAAIYMLDQLVFLPEQEQPKYPPGSVLCHCASGRSRSVTICALYLYFKFGLFYRIDEWSNWDTTYQTVQKDRCDPSKYPTQGMKDSSRDLVNRYAKLFPLAVLAPE